MPKKLCEKPHRGAGKDGKTVETGDRVVVGGRARAIVCRPFSTCGLRNSGRTSVSAFFFTRDFGYRSNVGLNCLASATAASRHSLSRTRPKGLASAS